jgi:hypothetical protein
LRGVTSSFGDEVDTSSIKLANNSMQWTSLRAATDADRSHRRLRVGVNRGADFVKYLVPPRKRDRTRHLT